MDRVIVYIDGFNLYYGIRDTPYKWLGLRALCRTLLPNDHIVHIKYFTARVRATPADANVPLRQQIYLRALRTLPDFSIHYGHFLTSTPWMPVVQPPPKFIQVHKTEEKGSDVNLATHLLADGFLGSYDTAVVISNDSDLCPPIEMVKNQLGRKVGLVNPHPRTPSKPLGRLATFYKELRAGPSRPPYSRTRCKTAEAHSGNRRAGDSR